MAGHAALVCFRLPVLWTALGSLFYFVLASRTICAASCGVLACASISLAMVSNIVFNWSFVMPSCISFLPPAWCVFCNHFLITFILYIDYM
nr:MAG TPA: hypothetical protein [Caudoviricetes sp.]